MKIRYALALLFGICICVLHAEVIKIGLYYHPPIVMKAVDGEAYGPGVDYAEAIARAMGYEPSVELLPVARLVTYLKNGTIDIALEFGMNDERKKFVHFSEKPCLITNPSLTVMSDNPLTSIQSAKDVSGMRIGYILGAYPG